jgi:hypothetical protein
VLRLLASTKKTGRLLITGNRGSGSVWVDAGEVVGSEATGSIPDASAVDVLFELLRYGDGSFTFEAGTTTPEPTKARAVEPLLLDAERQLTELDVCRSLKELVELGVVKVRATPMPAAKAVDAFPSTVVFAEPQAPAEDEVVAGSGATWDPFSIEIPGVDSLVPIAADPDPDPEPEVEPGLDLGVAKVDVMSIADLGAPDDEVADADEVAKQLASLSPKAAQAVAAAAKAATVEERDAALDEMDDDDEPVNRGLLLKFLSSVKS